MAKKRAYKRANGTGGISRMKGRRRKPYRVRVTTGYEIDMETGKCKQVVKTLGTYETLAEARRALDEYNCCPYDLSASNMTMNELFEKWYAEHEKKLSRDFSKNGILLTWRYCQSIYKMHIRDVRSYHLKDCIASARTIVTRGSKKGELKEASPNTKANIKSVFNMMFDYASERDLVDKNYARAFKLDEKVKDEQLRARKKINIFTQDEIKILWENVNTCPFADMILIGIYSGWRPDELAKMKVADVNLQEGYFVGGSKTSAGKNRVVPIHKDIVGLVEARMRSAEKLGSESLFNDVDGSNEKTFSYYNYRYRFSKVVSELNLNKHHPHETRHTFYTACDRSGMSEYIRDKIVGHSNKKSPMSVVYDHQDINDMKEAMAKVKFL